MNVTITGEGMQKCRYLLGTYGISSGTDLYCATPDVKKDIIFLGGFIFGASQFSRLKTKK